MIKLIRVTATIVEGDREVSLDFNSATYRAKLDGEAYGHELAFFLALTDLTRAYQKRGPQALSHPPTAEEPNR